MNPEILNELFKAAGVQVKFVDCSNEEGCQKEDEEEIEESEGYKDLYPHVRDAALQYAIRFYSKDPGINPDTLLSVANKFHKFLSAKD